jgi:hypothetical protein
MSAGQLPHPTPPQPTVQPVVVTPPQPVLSPAMKWTGLILLALNLLIGISDKMGWVTPDQKKTAEEFRDAIAPLLLAKQDETVTQTTTVETKTETTEPKAIKTPTPLVPVAEKPAAASDIDWKAILDKLLPVVIDRLDDWLKPNPVPPTPPLPPVPPVTPIPPVVPIPDPVTPVPLPGDSKIVISDESGKALTAATVEAGALFLATSSTPGKVAWGKSIHGAARVIPMPSNAGFAFSLQAGSFVEFFLTDSALNQSSIRITCTTTTPVVPQPITPDTVIPQPPIPQPVTPINDVFGLSKASYEGKSRVISGNRAAEARIIAVAHRSVAKKAADNPFGLISSMQTEVAAEIKKGLNPQQLVLWKPWSAAVQARVKALQAENKLSDRQQWIDGFLEISNGLEIEP